MKNSLTPHQTVDALDSVNKLLDYFRQADLDPSSQYFVESLLYALHTYAFNVQKNAHSSASTSTNESTVVGQ